MTFVFLSGKQECNSRNYCIDSNHILLKNEDQVLIVGSVLGQKSAVYVVLIVRVVLAAAVDVMFMVIDWCHAKCLSVYRSSKEDACSR